MLVLLVVNLVNIVNRQTGNKQNRLVTVPFRPPGPLIKQNRRVLTSQNTYFHEKNQHCFAMTHDEAVVVSELFLGLFHNYQSVLGKSSPE